MQANSRGRWAPEQAGKGHPSFQPGTAACFRAARRPRPVACEQHKEDGHMSYNGWMDGRMESVVCEVHSDRGVVVGRRWRASRSTGSVLV